MAGGGGGMEVPQRVKRGSKARKRKKKNRIGFRLDMTPLVDVAFLLLTFFMYTTSLITPQIMKMSVPKSPEQVEVNMNNLFTLQIGPNGKVFTSMAQDDPVEIKMSELKNKAVELNMMRKNVLITSFKASPEAPYGTIIKVLDILNQAEGEIVRKLRQEDPNIKRARKFAFVKMTKEEEDKLRGM
ncbi:MAG: ExbD/TolR family protein [Candidatus Kapaibacterium sp.]